MSDHHNNAFSKNSVKQQYVLKDRINISSSTGAWILPFMGR